MLSLQSFLTSLFNGWQPCSPRVVSRTKYSVTLDWRQVTFTFLSQDLLYRLERKEKLRGWVIEYCGSKTVKEITNLGSCTPHKFRVRVILRTHAVSRLAHAAINHFGTEHAVYEHFTLKSDTKVDNKNEEVNESVNEEDNVNVNVEVMDNSSGDKDIKVISDLKRSEHVNGKKPNSKDKEYHKGDGDTEELNVGVKKKVESKLNEDNLKPKDKKCHKSDDVKEELNVEVKTKVSKPIEAKKPWLESQWSEESWALTESEGQTPASFCLAVRGGYTIQVQAMLEDRPALLEMINTTNGYTPLATAALKGDVNMVKLLLSSGAEVDGLSANNRTALHVALLAGHADVAAVLFDQGALIQVRDVIGLRAEHCAVDGGSMEALDVVLSHGGDLTVCDHNGWTPLFRAVVGEASTSMIEELIRAGSDVNVADDVGLSLLAAARVMRGPEGSVSRSRRVSLVRAVDASFGHEAAHAHYTRLTRKIRTLRTAIM